MNDVCLIPLTDGYYAIVDLIDYKTLCKYKWSTFKNHSGVKYARANICGNNVLMHWVLMGRESEIDHINGFGLDNRRINLRHCSRAQNQQNREKFKNNKSGFCGVCRNRGKWRARITAFGKCEFLGSFDNKIDAAIAYDAAAKRLHGEFARTNF